MKERTPCPVGTCEEMKALQAQCTTARPDCSGDSPEALEAQLRERVKELDCLYRLTNLIERHEDAIDRILQETVALLPVSWQYPEIACARIRYREQVYTSEHFKGTKWRQTSPIVISGRKEGVVEVHYLKKKPEQDEGPFLKEERQLIDAVSNRIAKAAERIRTKSQLEGERRALQEANAALHDSLVQNQKAKKMLGQSMQAKIDKILSPIFYALRASSTPSQLDYLELLRKNLDDIVSPFVEGGREATSMLSPVELQIANMIKHGFSSKKIASLRGISLTTVNRHRENIRRKLGITNSKVNLVSYLNRA